MMLVSRMSCDPPLKMAVLALFLLVFLTNLIALYNLSTLLFVFDEIGYFRIRIKYTLIVPVLQTVRLSGDPRLVNLILLHYC